MFRPTQSISAYLLKDLVRKLDPSRFPGMPPILAALTGFILGAEFFCPRIIEVVITDTGTVLAGVNGDAIEGRVIGSYSDVMRNWMRFISQAGITLQEFMAVQCLFAEKVGFFGPANA
jgi:hypothetical protein